MDSILVFSIKDCSLNRFVSPFCARSEAEAKAMVRDSIQPDSIIGKHLGSFELYALCYFSESRGIAIPENSDSFDGLDYFPPRYICKVSDLFDGLV